MNLTILLQFGFSASLQKLLRWLPVRKATRSCAIIAPHTEARAPIAISVVGHTSPSLEAIDPLSALHRPLRVVRVLEAGQPRSHVGRMLISGCMADVCAELDRLAAREAALS